jgi:hypothetical protein
MVEVKEKSHKNDVEKELRSRAITNSSSSLQNRQAACVILTGGVLHLSKRALHLVLLS